MNIKIKIFTSVSIACLFMSFIPHGKQAANAMTYAEAVIYIYDFCRNNPQNKTPYNLCVDRGLKCIQDQSNSQERTFTDLSPSSDSSQFSRDAKKEQIDISICSF